MQKKVGEIIVDFQETDIENIKRLYYGVDDIFNVAHI